jgi:hypothetical protein
LQLFILAWSWTSVLQISVSQVSRIIGMNQWPVWASFLMISY